MELPVTLYCGAVRPLPPDGRPSAIIKDRVRGPIALDIGGLAGDQQADRRVHGGADKAVHLFPVTHYARLAAAVPEAADRLIAGSIGENISVSGLDESTVRIGEVFALGTARLQVSEPRSPCWKIDARYGVSGLTAFIAEHGCAGWYLRVLTAGVVQEDDRLRRLPDDPAGDPQAPTLAEFFTLWQHHRPDPGALETLAALPALGGNWPRKLRERAAWLRANPPAAD